MAHRREQSALTRGRGRTWTDEQCFEAIRSAAVDGVATCTAYDAMHETAPEDSPVRATLMWRFGSWRNAVHAAGLKISNENVPKTYANRTSNEGLVLAIQDCAATLGRWPSVNQYSVWCRGSRAPSTGIIRQRFGSWIVALEAAMADSGDLELAA